MKKAQVKALKRLASMLPDSVELQKYTEVIPASEIDIDTKRRVGISDEGYGQRQANRLMPICHIRRLKNAWKRNKEQGLVEYINWVDNNNKKLNKLNEDLKLSAVNDNILQMANKGAKGFWKRLIQFLLAFVMVFDTKKEAA